MSPRLRQSLHLNRPHYHGTDPPSIIFTHHNCWNAWDRLVVHPKEGPVVQGSTIAQLRRRETTPSDLESLPPEIIANIVAYVAMPPLVAKKKTKRTKKTKKQRNNKQRADEGTDKSTNAPPIDPRRQAVLSLGLTSTMMFVHLIRHLTFTRSHNPSTASCANSWAGTELACTGTWLLAAPPAFVKAGLAPSPEPEFHMAGRGMAAPRRWNWDAMTNYDRVYRPAEADLWMAALGSAGEAEAWLSREGDGGGSEVVRNLVSGAASGVSLDDENHAGKWRLRNLSKKEFVALVPPRMVGGGQETMSRAMVETSKRVKKTVPLDDALLMRICWMSQGPPFDLYRNPYAEWANCAWAGDRFDIVRADGKGEDEEDWKDVTEEVVNEAMDLKRKLKIKSSR